MPNRPRRAANKKSRQNPRGPIPSWSMASFSSIIRAVPNSTIGGQIINTTFLVEFL